jgi:mRNA interferase MazF
MGMVKQFEVYLINLDPTTGSEIKKTRPCVVISPNEMHRLNTVIIAPMTSTCKLYPTRIPVSFEKKDGYIVLDQIRTVDKSRLVKLLGTIDKKTAHEVLKILQEMFT